jgi:hypothetical protein
VAAEGGGVLPPPYNRENPTFVADLRAAMQTVLRALKRARDGLTFPELVDLAPGSATPDGKYGAQLIVCGVAELLAERKVHLWIVDRYTKPGVIEAEIRVIPASAS